MPAQPASGLLFGIQMDALGVRSQAGGGRWVGMRQVGSGVSSSMGSWARPGRSAASASLPLELSKPALTKALPAVAPSRELDIESPADMEASRLLPVWASLPVTGVESTENEASPASNPTGRGATPAVQNPPARVPPCTRVPQLLPAEPQGTAVALR